MLILSGVIGISGLVRDNGPHTSGPCALYSSSKWGQDGPTAWPAISRKRVDVGEGS